MAGDAAEDIVNVWLNEKGYFTRRNIKVGRKEIDLLGINKEGKGVHAEVTVSINPFTKNIAKERKQTRDFYTKKFKDKEITDKIHELLGRHKKYQKWIILGIKESKRKTEKEKKKNREKWRKVWKNRGKVKEVRFMDEVLEEIDFKEVPQDYASNFIMILKKYDKKATT